MINPVEVSAIDCAVTVHVAPPEPGFLDIEALRAAAAKRLA